jgi:hypothetical protein
MLASGLLVMTTIVAGAWTIASLSRLGRIASETVRGNDVIAAATARVSGGLEREDHALLLVLAGDQRARSVLASERAIVSRSLAELIRQLEGDAEREMGRVLNRQVHEYRLAVDRIALAAPEPDRTMWWHASLPRFRSRGNTGFTGMGATRTPRARNGSGRRPRKVARR